MARNDKTFRPGASGNPGGRPRGVEGRARAVIESRTYKAADGETYAGPEALVHLYLDIAYDDDEATKERLKAAELAIDRGYGKAKQSVEVSGGISPDQQALLDALRMTPHERRLAQDTTATEDDQAMADLVEAGDVVGE